MEETLVFTLENDEEYNEISRVTYNDTKYLLLSNAKNPVDTCIRKLVNENNQEYICRLNDDELSKVLNLFIKQSDISSEKNN